MLSSGGFPDPDRRVRGCGFIDQPCARPCARFRLLTATGNPSPIGRELHSRNAPLMTPQSHRLFVVESVWFRRFGSRRIRGPLDGRDTGPVHQRLIPLPPMSLLRLEFVLICLTPGPSVSPEGMRLVAQVVRAVFAFAIGGANIEGATAAVWQGYFMAHPALVHDVWCEGRGFRAEWSHVAGRRGSRGSSRRFLNPAAF